MDGELLPRREDDTLPMRNMMDDDHYDTRTQTIRAIEYMEAAMALNIWG